jgi:hypothetical protein
MHPDDITPPEPVPPHTPEQTPPAPQQPPPAEDDRPPPHPVKLPGQPHAPERVARVA